MNIINFSYYIALTFLMGQELPISLGKMVVQVIIWLQLGLMVPLPYIIGKVNYKTESFYKRKLLLEFYFLLTDNHISTLNIRLCTGFSWDSEGDILSIITNSSTQVCKSNLGIEY